MADFFNPTTDFEMEVPEYSKDLAEAEQDFHLQQVKKQQENEERRYRAEVEAGEKSGPVPPSETNTAAPTAPSQSSNQPSSSGKKQPGDPGTNPNRPPEGKEDQYQFNEDTGEYEMKANEMLGHLVNAPLQAAAGVGDTVFDALGLIPGLKPAEEWWEETTDKDNESSEYKFIRDISAIVVPSLLIGGPLGTALGVGAKALGFANLTKGGVAVLGKIAVDMGVGAAIEGISDQTSEQGNFSDLLNNTLGIQTPWLTEEGDSPDTIYKNNMYESAAMGGMVGAIELALHSNIVGRVAKKFIKASTKIVPADKKALDAVQASSEASKIKTTTTTKAAKEAAEPSPIDKVAATDNSRVAAQNEEAVQRYTADPEGEKGYDSFVNEPHEPQARAVPGHDADPIKFKVGNAKIKTNTGTVNGRTPAAYTPGILKRLLNVGSSIERHEIVKEMGEQIDPRLSVVFGKIKLTEDQVEQAVDDIVSAVNDPTEFNRQLEGLKQGFNTILGHNVNTLSTDGEFVARGALEKLTTMLELVGKKQSRASAVVQNQAAGQMSDVARSLDFIDDTMDTSRQRELLWNAHKTLSQEDRTFRGIQGKVLGLLRSGEAGEPWKLSKALDEADESIDEMISRVKIENEKFYDTILDIERENPKYFNPLFREWQKSNGHTDTIHKLNKLVNNKIGFLKKAFYDGNPEMPSLFVKMLQSVRYNNILTGLAPVRAAVGAGTGLVGKPVTSFVGSALTGDKENFKRSMFVFSGIGENIRRAQKLMSDEWRNALLSPELAQKSMRQDFRGSDAVLNDMQTMDEMCDIWLEKNPLSGRAALWQVTKVMSAFNNNNIVRFGINSMTAIDGFVKSFSASFAARSQAYDELFEVGNGAVNTKEFRTRQAEIYSTMFDKHGVLKTNNAAHNIAGEINLNMDSKTVSALENVMARIPIAKSIFMFPRTGVNSLKLVSTFSPTGLLGQSIGRGRDIAKAVTQAEIDDVLLTHGYKAGNNAAFKALKAEYKGRELAGGAVVFGAAIYALNGNLTGSGPSDPGERARMKKMGWNEYSFKDPFSGEWRSYKGLEPFDTFLGLTADIVYEGGRWDSAITEEWFQTLAHSISMNITNKTFLSGFEPLVRLMSQDPGAMERFTAMQANSLIPGTGVRSILNKAISPQLKDFKRTFQGYLANSNKSLPFANSNLFDAVDIYTGKPINYTDPLNAAINSVLPFANTNGGNEEWRQKLLRTGWDGLQTVRVNPQSQQPLTPEQRNKVNGWIGKNYNLAELVDDFLSRDDDWYERELKSYAKARGLRKQSEYPIKVTFIHDQLTKMHNKAYKLAFDELNRENPELFHTGVLQNAVESQISKGDYLDAVVTADRKKRILEY